MFDDGARDYNIHRGVFERKSIRRCVTYYFEIETEIEAKLVFGAICADNQMRLRLSDEGKKRAVLASTDIEHHLTRLSIYQFRNLILI